MNLPPSLSDDAKLLRQTLGWPCAAQRNVELLLGWAADRPHTV